VNNKDLKILIKTLSDQASIKMPLLPLRS